MSHKILNLLSSFPCSLLNIFVMNDENVAPAVNRGFYADQFRRLLCKQARARESVTEPGADDHGDHDHRIVNDENVLLAPAVNRGHYADNYRRLLCKQARARESVTEPGADDHGDHDDHRIVNDENVLAPAVNRGHYADNYRRKFA
jgi:hypothetical protein